VSALHGCWTRWSFSRRTCRISWILISSGEAMPKGKVIVITGAASGLGEAWVKGFLNDGATVIAADINELKLDAIANMGALTITADVAVEAEVKSVIDFALDKAGQIDVLFNNAGIGINKPFLEVPEGEFERHIAVHLYGTVYGMRYALPHMLKRGKGRIINTLSRAAEISGKRNAAYASAARGASWQSVLR
jgi:NAD(P)-dependent dehydrogenase (short-subunit alcohol dehydrogenase family)